MKNLLFYYCLVLAILLTLGTAYSAQTASVIPLILFLPITVYFLSLFLGKINSYRFSFPFQKPLSNLGLYYGFIIVTVMAASGLIGAKNTPQLISSIIFLPLAGYFTWQVLPRRRHAVNIPAIVLQPQELEPIKQKQPSIQSKKRPVKLLKMNKLSPLGVDVNRRRFLKLISSAGLSLFLFSIFTKKAEAAFFGSVPGPGAVAIKDSGGTQIDPAVKTPTDGYKITEIDDSSPAYYGFVDKDGKWFIMKESSGAYRYVKGDSDFTDAWGIRQTRDQNDYKYFNVTF